jgi:hypothetical protein
VPYACGETVRFPSETCAVCALRDQCTTSAAGRSVSIHPDERLLAEPRERPRTPAGWANPRERVAVGHSLAHVGHWQGDRARYRGVRKNLFDLRRCAVVHNLHVIARLPEPEPSQSTTPRPRDYLTGVLDARRTGDQPGDGIGDAGGQPTENGCLDRPAQRLESREPGFDRTEDRERHNR